MTGRLAEILKGRLSDFSNEMLTKFRAVERKHQYDSVTDDAVNWARLDWESIEKHFWREVKEVRAKRRRGKEYVDVANMAFLMWWAIENKVL